MNKELQILLIGGDARVRKLVTRALPQASGELYVSASGLQAEALTADRSFDLILLNLVLPDLDGRTLLARLRQSSQTAETPVFVLSVAQAPHLEAECLALGADAVFAKPLRRSRLRDAVESILNPAPAPPALPSRPVLQAAFEETRKQADTSGTPLHFILFRIDGFEEAVDAHGAALEHQLIDRIGQDMDETLGPSSLWVRWDHDEFAALSMPESSDDLPTALVQLQKQVKAKRFQVDDGDPVRVTLSVVTVEVFDNVSLDEVTARADRLMADPTGLARRSALFVMPNDLLPAAIRRRLERDGFDMIHAPDHLAALTAGVSQKMFDIALIDSEMRDEDGKPTLPVVTRLSSLRTTPFILLVDRGKEEQLAYGFRNGATDYLTRPFSVTDLIGRLNFVLKKHPPREAEPPASETTEVDLPLVEEPQEEARTEDPQEPLKLPSDPVLEALAQVVRTRLIEGQPVSIPDLGDLEVRSVPSRVLTREDGQLVVEPPRNKITFVPVDPAPPSETDPAP